MQASWACFSSLEKLKTILRVKSRWIWFQHDLRSEKLEIFVDSSPVTFYKCFARSIYSSSWAELLYIVILLSVLIINISTFPVIWEYIAENLRFSNLLALTLLCAYAEECFSSPRYFGYEIWSFIEWIDRRINRFRWILYKLWDIFVVHLANF